MRDIRETNNIMKKNLTDSFIEGLIAKSLAIPESVNRQARKCLLDYIGVTVGGARFLMGCHPELFDTFTKDIGTCSVLGTEYKTTGANAALLNGYSAHVLELDDGHRIGMIHLGACVISAILAVAERDNLGFERILRGIVMGYESSVRCACALQPGHKLRGYHVSGTCGTIGSAMGVAFACDYSKEQIESTLACAVTSAAGLLEIQEDASELKPYNLGRAAMDGVMASDMGKLAILGPDDILGGRRGLLAVLTDTPEQSYLKKFDNDDYCIEGIYQKEYAACRHCHPAIEAAISICNDNGINPEQIDVVEVKTYKLAVIGHDHAEVKGLSSAKLSTPYSVALAIVRGGAGYEDYEESILTDESILSLAKRVLVLEDAQLTLLSPKIRAARVEIVTKEGNVYEKRIDYPKGEPENPISFEGIKHKTMMLTRECNNRFVEVLLGKLWD